MLFRSDSTHEYHHFFTKFLSQVSSSFNAFHQTTVAPADSSAPPPFIPTQPSLPVPSLQPSASSSNSPTGLNQLHTFLLHLLPILDPYSSTVSPLLSKVRSKLDYYSPSRLHILQPEGPFSLETLFTQAGIFSALIFRGVTFNSKSIFDHSGYFCSDRKSTRLNSSHSGESRMPSSA